MTNNNTPIQILAIILTLTITILPIFIGIYIAQALNLIHTTNTLNTILTTIIIILLIIITNTTLGLGRNT